MAQQLATEAQEEAVVVLFDTNFTQHSSSISQKAASTSSVFLSLLQIPASERWGYLWRIVRAPFKPIQWWLHVARLPRIVQKVRKACLQAERGYMPRPYSGRVILFRSDHIPLGQITDPREGWSDYVARGLEIYEIAGNHENILLEPQVRSVAQQLKVCLDDALAAHQISLTKMSRLKRAVQ
jgi:thioesterase domain-containing protein